MSIKDIEKNLVSINENLLACKYETSNELYQVFSKFSKRFENQYFSEN